MTIGSIKIKSDVKKYVIDRKKKNPALTCRKLALESSNKFSVNISKSSINKILKTARLSSPVGRSVANIFRPELESVGAGYVFLAGANILLKLSKMLSETVKASHPGMRLKDDTLEAISDAWIMSKAVYNVSLEKITDFSKDEIWFLVGRKVSKGHLRKYFEAIKMLQSIKNTIVRELTVLLQDVCYLKFHLADNASFSIDGQFRSIWGQGVVPVDFSTTIDIANSYINKAIFGSEPTVIFNTKPETMLGDELSNLIFCLDGASPLQRIRKIEYVSHNSNIIKEIPFVVPDKRFFIIGIWPWQYKAISDLEKKPASEKLFLEPKGDEYFFSEDTVKFTQHVHNIEVMLRMIVVKLSSVGPARIAIFTNLDQSEWDMRRVVEFYLRRWPDIDSGHKIFIQTLKNPTYLEDFITSEKMLNLAKKINSVDDIDEIFSVLVEILNEYSKRSFFPTDCNQWSLLKMRELFYKQKGRIKRDMSSDILFKLLPCNELYNNNFLNTACIKFNESNVVDFSGRKIWALSTA